MKIPIGLMLMFLIVFNGTALAQPNNAGLLLAKSTSEDKSPINLDKDTLRHEYDKRNGKAIDQNKTNCKSDVIKKKIHLKHWWKSRYCRPSIENWCQKICGDVSPHRPGGSKRWGKTCNPGLLSRCERCDFLP